MALISTLGKRHFYCSKYTPKNHFDKENMNIGY
jgi:hypothetical protein